MEAGIETSQDMRETMDTDAARGQASVVGAVREMEKMTPRALPHISGLK